MYAFTYQYVFVNVDELVDVRLGLVACTVSMVTDGWRRREKLKLRVTRGYVLQLLRTKWLWYGFFFFLSSSHTKETEVTVIVTDRFREEQTINSVCKRRHMPYDYDRTLWFRVEKSHSTAAADGSKRNARTNTRQNKSRENAKDVSFSYNVFYTAVSLQDDLYFTFFQHGL